MSSCAALPAGMHLLGRLDDMDGDGIVAWVMTCWHGCGGFGGSEGHDPHVLYTLSAVQVSARACVYACDLLRVCVCACGVSICTFLSMCFVCDRERERHAVRIHPTRFCATAAKETPFQSGVE